MSSYIGKIQIDSGEEILIGSTLYGTCFTAAAAATKEVTLNNFDKSMKGITVHVRFINGNNVTSGLTLKVGSTDPQNIIGNCVCNPNDVVAFTYWEETVDNTIVKTWYVNNNIVIAEGNTDGTILINGQSVTVHGLGSAAYTNSSVYATAAQGILADNAMPKSGGTFTGAVMLPGIPLTNNEAATKQYVDSKVAGLDGLNTAMHFKGTVETVPPASGTYEAGDVVLAPNHKEYVYDGTNWIELGDEGSFVLQSAVTNGTASYIGTNDFTPNTLPTLTVDHTEVSQVTATESSISTTQYTIPKVTQAGTTMTASVAQGVLTLTPGSDTELASTDITIHGFNTSQNLTIPSVSVNTVYLDSQVHFTQGSAATLNKTDVTVLVPNNTP